MNAGTSACVACSATPLHRMADIGLSTLDRCRSCGLVVNHPRGPSQARDYYGDEYDGFYDHYYRVFRQRQFKDVVGRLAGVDFPSRRALDIGCSYGWFLQAALAGGFDAVGAEPSSRVFHHLKATTALDVHHCGIDGVGAIDGRFGLITLWNVFEHLPDPAAALAQVADKLEPNGVLLLCVPDVTGLITRLSFLAHTLSMGRLKSHLLKMYQMDNDFPHLYHYSRHSLELVLRRHGFEPFESWGQDIVDAANMGQRIAGYEGIRTPGKWLLAKAVGAVQGAGTLLGLQDERVVLARRAR